MNSSNETKWYKTVSGIVVITIISTVLMVPLIPWFLLGVLLPLTIPNPPAPRVKYGEFPFRVEYEINGERIIVEDTFIARFAGHGYDFGRGKFRKWNGYVASNRKSGVVILKDGAKTIYLSVGGPGYYMGDAGFAPGERLIPGFIMEERRDGILHESSRKELFEPYNIRLIDWELSDPIEDNFD